MKPNDFNAYELGIRVAIEGSMRSLGLVKCEVGGLPALVGNHPAIQQARETIARIGTSSCSVLISGERGTGKELVAALIHDASPRREAPLVILHCSAVPEDKLEAELVRRFTEATGGTLLLDEIGELEALMQVLVLRLVNRDHDVRILAATHRDLEEEVAAGRFREDLFYRLNVIHIPLPPLRERPQDIEALADHFLEAAMARARRQDLVGLTEEALAALRACDWSGNVRALQNAIERGVLLATGPRVGIEDLPDRVTAQRASGVHAVSPATLPAEGIDLRSAVDRYETTLVRQALERTSNNKNAAAQLLRMNRTTLVEMVKRKGL